MVCVVAGLGLVFFLYDFYVRRATAAAAAAAEAAAEVAAARESRALKSLRHAARHAASSSEVLAAACDALLTLAPAACGSAVATRWRHAKAAGGKTPADGGAVGDTIREQEEEEEEEEAAAEEEEEATRGWGVLSPSFGGDASSGAAACASLSLLDSAAVPHGMDSHADWAAAAAGRWRQSTGGSGGGDDGAEAPWACPHRALTLPITAGGRVVAAAVLACAL